jgi:hypothetical protein
MSWDQRFPAPIDVDGKRSFVTLRDAAAYITKLPGPDQADPRWQTAIHVLIQTADHGGPMEFARLGIEQALRPMMPVYDTSRKDPKWRNTRKLVRDSGDQSSNPLMGTSIATPLLTGSPSMSNFCRSVQHLSKSLKKRSPMNW